MIVFIDGTYGVGKTSVVSEIKKKFANDDMVFIEADFWFRKMCDCRIHQAKKEATPNIGGDVSTDKYNIHKIFSEENYRESKR